MIYGFTSKTFTLSVTPNKVNAITSYNLPDGYQMSISLSFDDGLNWTIVMDTVAGIDELGKVVSITDPGSNVICRIEIDVPDGEADMVFNDQWIEGIVERNGLPVSGVQVDLCHVESGEVLFWTVTDKNGWYGMEVAPGTYIRRFKGAGFNDAGRKIQVGIGSTLFGKDVFDVAKADDLAYSKNVFTQSEWAGWMILLTFKDDSLRANPEIYADRLICKYGYAYKGKANVDYVALIMNPEPEVLA